MSITRSRIYVCIALWHLSNILIATRVNLCTEKEDRKKGILSKELSLSYSLQTYNKYWYYLLLSWKLVKGRACLLARWFFFNSRINRYSFITYKCDKKKSRLLDSILMQVFLCWVTSGNNCGMSVIMRFTFGIGFGRSWLSWWSQIYPVEVKFIHPSAIDEIKLLTNIEDRFNRLDLLVMWRRRQFYKSIINCQFIY